MKKRANHGPSRTSHSASPETAPPAGHLGAALEALFTETTALFHRLRVVAKQLHRQGEISAGKRGILRSLDRLGPQTVPQMARARPVSRQHIQALVNPLADQGYVEFTRNPAHKRSPLVRLTPQGQAVVEAMNRREAEVLAALKIDATEQELRDAAAVLRTVRQAFESDECQNLLETIGAENGQHTGGTEERKA